MLLGLVSQCRLAYVKHEIHRTSPCGSVVLAKSGGIPGIAIYGIHILHAHLIPEAPAHAHYAPQLAFHTQAHLHPLFLGMQVLEGDGRGSTIDRVGKVRILEVEVIRGECLTQSAEESVAIDLLVEVVVHTYPVIGSRGAELIGVLASLAGAVSYAQFHNGKVFLLEVESSRDLHIGIFQSHALHGKSHQVGTYSYSAKEWCLLLRRYLRRHGLPLCQQGGSKDGRKPYATDESEYSQSGHSQQGFG